MSSETQDSSYAIGEVEGADGERLVVGVEGDAVAVYVGDWMSADGCRLNSAQVEEFAALFIHAAWQAGAGAARLQDDLRECSRCGDRVAYLSSRDWCDGCEQEEGQAEGLAAADLDPDWPGHGDEPS
jgi:hypothetical protein